jgi:23S rRNA (cytosine1962-C5)-methyltransferase
VLNLFAYTGLASLVLARAGASVVHVDASRPSVAWARRNADLAGLADRPIRWLVEDAARFVAREVRRGRRYDGVVLDPPSYGHGPGGGAWHLADDLLPLVAAIAPLLAADRWFLACTSHTAALEPDELAGIVGQALGWAAGTPPVVELALQAESGARLAAGWAVLAASAPAEAGW